MLLEEPELLSYSFSGHWRNYFRVVCRLRRSRIMHSISFTILQLLPTLFLPMSKFFTVFAFAFSFRPSIVLFRCVKRSCCYSYFCLTSASLSHVVNLSRLLLRVLLDQVRSKNGKAFLYSATRPSDQIRTKGPLSSSTLSGSSTIPL